MNIDLGDIIFSITEKALGNHKLLDVGISGQKISIAKKSKTLKHTVTKRTHLNIYSKTTNTLVYTDAHKVREKKERRLLRMNAPP